MKAARQPAKPTGDTRLAVFCGYVIEVGWLAAALLMPLFFNVFSARSFEPDKLIALRVIVVIMLAAALVRWLEKSPLRWSLASLRHWATATPFSIPVLLLALVLLITTLTSITPGVSFWGSYSRLQGTLTALTYMALFFFVAHGVRSHQQRDRLITTILVTSLPISLYAIFQHYGFDPFPWSQDVTQRVIGTMGNAIFLGAYLIMVVPLTLARWLEALSNVRHLRGQAAKASKESATATPSPWNRHLVGLSLLLVIQLLAILYTQSRGPWLGLGLGLSVMVGLLAWRRGKRRLLLATIAAALAAILFTVALNVPRSPLAPLKAASPYLQRLGTIMDLESGTNKVRLLLWFGDDVGRGASGILTADPLRLIIGYGPESIALAYYPYYPPALAYYEMRGNIPDRTHNQFLDTLLTTGLLGLFAYLLVIVVFLWLGIKLLRQAQRFPIQLLVAGLLGGVVAHLGEVFFGFGIAATLTYFWLYMGIMVATWRMMATESTAQPDRLPVTSQLRGNAYALLAYLVATVIALPFLVSKPVLAWGLQNPFVLVLLGLGWALFGWGIAARALGSAPRSALLFPISRASAYLAILAGLAGLLWVLLSPVVADIHAKLGFSYASAARLEGAADAYLDAIKWDSSQEVYFGELGRVYMRQVEIAVGRFHTPVKEVSELYELRRLADLDQGTIASAADVAFTQARRINPLSPDPIANLARLYYVMGSMSKDQQARDEYWERSSQYYQQATKLNPNAPHLFVDWGLIYYRQSRFEEALAKYLKALELDPNYSVTFLALGDVFSAQELWEQGEQAYRWGLYIEPDSARLLSALGSLYFKQGKFSAALEEHRKASLLTPRDPVGHMNLALAYRGLGRIDEAITEAEKALDLSPQGQRADLERLVADLKGSKK